MRWIWTVERPTVNQKIAGLVLVHPCVKVSLGHTLNLSLFLVVIGWRRCLGASISVNMGEWDGDCKGL